MKRILTTVVLLPFAMAAVFYLPEVWFWLFVVAIIELAAVEYVRITRRWAPTSPRWILLLTVPAASALLAAMLWEGVEPETMWSFWLGLLVLLAVGLAVLALAGRTPVDEAIGMLGTLSWGTVCFSVAAVSVWALQSIDPWVLVLLLAVVWIGDGAAFYVGRAFGRHRLAPVVSPKKSWEGAIANLVAGLLAALVWALWRLGEPQWGLVAVAGLANIAGQFGDLAESMIKRGAGIKDSGTLLPGHGGMWDRLDALLFAAPVLLLGVWLLGLDAGSFR
jgi:phosphatidate cytidylyltransferase